MQRKRARKPRSCAKPGMMARSRRRDHNTDWRLTKRFYAILALALMGMALAIGSQQMLLAVRHSSFFQLSEVILQGTCLLDKEEILGFVRPLISRSVFALNLELMARTVETHPMVKRAVVRRMLPKSMVITIQERQPVALLVVERRLYGIDEEGVLLPPFKPSLQPNLPLFTGWKPGPCKIGEPLKSEGISTAIGLLNTIKAFDPLMVYEISEIRLDTPRNMVFYLVEDSIRVSIGKGNYQEKVAGLRAVLSELKHSNLAFVQYIDLRFEGQVVVGQKGARPLSEAG